DMSTLKTIADAAGRQIPPLWPLASSVAVNPFLGQTGESLAGAGARLARAGGVPVTMTRAWYAERISTGLITDQDLARAADRSRHAGGPATVAALKSAASLPRPVLQAAPTVADLASGVSGLDWTAIIEDRFGLWAGSYFDAGQALWHAPQDKRVWSAFRKHATHDVTPEIMGLSGFAAFVADAPDSAVEAIDRAIRRLGLGPDALEAYFHRLLLSLGGWSQFARYRLWQAELGGETDTALIDCLAIRLLWEEALYCQYEAKIASRWTDLCQSYAAPVAPDADDIIDEALQEAAEHAAQRLLAARLSRPVPAAQPDRPQLQAAFCIDVRSEVFRRALETVDPSIRTFGFAGFFGMSASHSRFASDVAEHRLPVLLNASLSSSATGPETATADTTARYTARAKRAWGRFRLAAVSSFAFVEAMGPVYGGKLVRDALGCHPVAAAKDPKPHFTPEPDIATRTGMAETVLRAMS
ncbi:MAG: putative inorganic carbon transporter subunit DabA, partial [Rhodospirillales bacterium]